MKKKFRFFSYAILFIFLIIFISLWNLVSNGYDKQNQIILNLKKVIPRSVSVKVRDTFFIIPELKTKNKLLELQVKKYEQGYDGQLFNEKTHLIESSQWSSFLLKNRNDMELIQRLYKVAPNQGIDFVL